MSRWRILRKIKDNHKWFEDLQSGRIACADDGGTNPENTDDGILWLNKELPIVISDADNRIAIATPVIKSRNDRNCHIISGLDEMIYLVREHGMRVEIRTKNGTATLQVLTKEVPV